MPLIVVGLFLLLLIVNSIIKNVYYEETERSLESQSQIFKTLLKNQVTQFLQGGSAKLHWVGADDPIPQLKDYNLEFPPTRTHNEGIF